MYIQLSVYEKPDSCTECHTLLLQAPNICPGYQRGMYEISIYSDDGSGSLVHSFPPTLHSRENDEDEATIAKEMRTGLTYGVNYTVEVVHATLGIVHTKTKGFGKAEEIL